jgi:hypothetical protein
MDDLNFKIYFIFSQKNSKINIDLLENEEIIKIEQISSGNILNYSYILYCLTISNKKKVNNTTLTLLDNRGDLYTADIHLNKDEIFQYNIHFEPSDDNLNSLNQVKLEEKEQFTIFKNSLQNDNNIFYKLYLSRTNSFLEEMHSKINYESLLIFILELYALYRQHNELKDIIKLLFEKMNLKNINYKINDNSESSSLDENNILDNINIRENLV